MSDFAQSWSLSRRRFIDEILGLSQAQLNWRLQPDSLTIGEMALHVAGVELSFASQLTGTTLDEATNRIKEAATEGVVNDKAFPFGPAEITPQFVLDSLERSRRLWEPLITEAESDVRQREIKSALGPMITGDGAFARLGFHSAYHQGQAYLIKGAAGFPTS